MKYLKFLKKWLWCRWFHNKDLCYPEVWDRGLEGPWHCAKCHPCNEEVEKLFEEIKERIKNANS